MTCLVALSHFLRRVSDVLGYKSSRLVLFPIVSSASMRRSKSLISANNKNRFSLPRFHTTRLPAVGGSVLIALAALADDNRTKPDFTQKNCSKINYFSMEKYQPDPRDSTNESNHVIPCEYQNQFQPPLATCGTARILRRAVRV